MTPAETLAAVSALLEELGALEAKASPLPWKRGPRKANNTIEIYDADGKETCSIYSDWRVSKKMRADAALIVALRNALPRLRALVGEGEP